MSVKSRVHRCLDDIVQSSLFLSYCVQLYAMVDKKSHPVEECQMSMLNCDLRYLIGRMYKVATSTRPRIICHMDHVHMYSLKIFTPSFIGLLRKPRYAIRIYSRLRFTTRSYYKVTMML